MNTIWFRYWTNYEEKGKSLSGEAVEEHQRRFKREVHFLVKNFCDLEFHQYLNKRLDYTKENGRKDGAVIRRHMRELARFILLDKLRQRAGRFVTTRDIIPPKNCSPFWWRETVAGHEGKKLSSVEDTEHLSYGHLLRMVNDYYPELLTKRIELRGRMGRRKFSNGRRIDDHRKRIIETPFSKEEKIPPGIFELVVARAMRQDATPDFLKRMHLQAGEVAKSMICNRVDLAKLLAFREDVLKIIDDLGTNPFIDKVEKNEKQESFTESGIFDYLIQTLFLQVRTLVELRWFREKSERIQDSIIFREPRLPKYHRKDAKKVVNLSLQWFKNPEGVLELMGIAALSYIRYLKKSMPQVGLWLMQECLQQLNLPDDSKALTYYNIAMSYQQAEQHRLMLMWLRKSLWLWERIGDHPGDEADIHGYMAEYWRLQNNEKYLFHRNKAEELVKSSILTERRKAFHYLFLANCACMFQDREWEKRLYEFGLLVSAKSDDLEDFTLYFNQCLSDLDTFGARGPEGGSGRFAAPQDWSESISSPSFKMTFVDPDVGN